jgi:hypothetical protein
MNLKILKLRSGEELICQVLEVTKTKIKIINPFIFKTTTMADKMGSYDMTLLRDWLHNSEDKTASIPKNHIILEYEPKEDTKKLYNLQLESDKFIEEKIVSSDDEMNISPQDVFPSQENILEDFIQAIMNDMPANQNDYSWNKENLKLPKKSNKRKKSMPSPEMNSSEMDRHGIYVNMMIPAEAIMNLITSGILNPGDLLKMIDEVKKKNRFTGDEKHREDFGNKLSDWNPDPKSDDYK